MKILTIKPTENIPIRCEDNIILDIKEMGIIVRDGMDSAHDRSYGETLVYEALNL